jgi:hypothetical protein
MIGACESRRSFLKRSAGAVAVGLAARGVFAGEAMGAIELRLSTFCCDLTPPLGSPIYSGYQPLAQIEHPLLAKGVVLDDGGRRYVLCAVDYCELCNSTHTLFRRKLAEAVGTEVSRVAVQTVHQHTAPMADADAYRLLLAAKDPPALLDPEFYDRASDRLGDAARRSLAQLEPFDRVGTGQAKVDRVASSRRVKAADGSILVRWSSCVDPTLRAMPEGTIDPFVKTITFAQGDKPLVRLHYYATHPQSFYGDPRASYDVPGIARQRLEQEEGVPQIYFTGCGGDVTFGKYNDRSPAARSELAERLFAGLKASAASTRYTSAEPIRWRTANVLLPPRTDEGYTRDDSLARMNDATVATSARLYAGAMRLAFLDRAAEPIELNSLQIGPTFVLHLPGESMVEFQLYAQRIMPGRFVAVAAYGDCSPGYICTAQAFEEGGYEPTDSVVAPESEQVLKQAIQQLLS